MEGTAHGTRHRFGHVAAEIAKRTVGVLDGLLANSGVSAPSEPSEKIRCLGAVAPGEALCPQVADPGSAPGPCVLMSTMLPDSVYHSWMH